MNEHQLFIAYHGTYDETGSLRKAEDLYRYLTANGVDCFLFSDVANTNSDAFIHTPLIANNCQKFILVCNEHIPTDSHGHATSNGVLNETEFFYKRIYHKKSFAGDARVYGYGQMTASMANDLHPIFQGVAHFTEIQYGRECFDEVLKWVNAPSVAPDTELLYDSNILEDIRAKSIRISAKSEYGISSSKFKKELLPQLEFDGGTVIENVFELELEKGRTYIIYANGGSGKSYSIKTIWNNSLHSEWLPLYVSVRSCYEKFGNKSHPLYEYLINTYRHFPEDPEELPTFLRKHDANWLILLDGYNEAQDITGIQNDLAEIDDFATTVLTTRDKSFVSGLNANSTLFLQIKPLRETVVREYISTHNKNPQALAMLSDANMMVMLKNPMLLTMFCNSFDSENYHFQLDEQTLLTPGELIEKCITAQLIKTDSANISTFFSILCLFPMTIADMYYRKMLSSMTVSRMDLTKTVTVLLKELDADSLEAFYLLEYADKWKLDVTGEEMEQLMNLIREGKPLEIRNELNSFERIMSKVLQFFTVDSQRSRIGGGLYRFDHQTYLNWYISYGIYVMAELWPQRFTEIIADITDGIDLMTESTDDFEEQSEFIFDLVRDSSDDENYRHFAVKLFNRHFAIRTFRLYEIATGCIELFDHSNVSPEEYADNVSSFCYSLFSNVPANMDPDAVLDKYGKKLEEVIRKCNRISDEEFKAITMAKINTIQGALCLALRSQYYKKHRNNQTVEDTDYLYKLAKEAEAYQLKALETREKVIQVGSGKYRDEMRNRITHSYTSLGTIAYFLKDYDKSIAYHKKAYDNRLAIMNDESVAEEFRNDARIRLSINLNRINGSLLTKGNIDRDTLKAMLEREQTLAKENKIEREMLNQLSNFTRELDMIGDDSELQNLARKSYEAINEAYIRMFGYQSEQLRTLAEKFLPLKQQRTNAAKRRITSFIASEPFQDIIKLFNDNNSTTDIEEINRIAENWDYRKKIAGGGERQSVTTEDDFVIPYRQRIIDDFRKLGMLDENTTGLPLPDYILPLGGYGLSNLKRCQLARKVADMFEDTDLDIVALSSHRVIVKEEEFNMAATYSSGAKTEYDQIDAAMKNAFDITADGISETHNEEGQKDYWVKTVYSSDNPHHSLCNLSAPCYSAERNRANTIDTFQHFLNCFDVAEGSKIILVSTALYGPYQMYSLLPTAIEHGVELYFTGVRYKDTDEEILATLCLQDLKSAVNAMYNFTKNHS